MEVGSWVSRNNFFLKFGLVLQTAEGIWSEEATKKFQRYRPINDPWRTILSAQGDIHAYGHMGICKKNMAKWGIPEKRIKNAAQRC